MIFALATDENTLMVFPSHSDAIAYCEGVDVKDGKWRFWLSDGTPLRAVFQQANQQARSYVSGGGYELVPAADLQHLNKAIISISQIQDNSHFDSLAALVGHLAFGPKASQHGT